MGSDAIVLRSFAGGELAPALAARADLAKYNEGLKTCRNFVVQRHGGVANRAGTHFVDPCKTNSQNVRLFRYVHETPASSVLIEAGVGYLRFFQDDALVEFDGTLVAAWNGATAYVIGTQVASGGHIWYCIKAHTNHVPPNATFWFDQGATSAAMPYVLGTPFTGTGIAEVSQSGRVLTITHHLVGPYELIFVALTAWVLQPVVTAPVVSPPTSPSLTNTVGTRKFGYVITAAAPDTYEESEPSGQVIDASAAAPTPDAPHQLSWTGVTVGGVAAPEYYIYCDPYGNGTYGYIGTATGQVTFNNPGIDPDFSLTPPLVRPLFAVAGEYPSVSATYQQRRFFANTDHQPDASYASRIGLPSNYGIASPLQDDDALTFRIAGNNNHPVRGLVALKNLVLLTDGGVWTAQGGDGKALTPNGIDLEQQTYAGVAPIPPAVIGNGILYVQARKSIVRDLRFDVQVDALNGRDLTVYAGHLFDGHTIRSMAYQEIPHSILWVCRDDGVLLGLTYVPEQDVWGWHRHDTATLAGTAAFEQVCVVPNDGEDDVYLVVARSIGGATVRYIEKLASRTILDFDNDAFFVDAGLSYSGAPATHFAGLGHLEGESVVALADGIVRGPFTVTAGAIDLPAAAAVVHVGLPYVGELETLALDATGSNIRDKKKRIAGVSLVVDASGRSFQAGQDAAHLVPYKLAIADGTGKSFTGRVELSSLGAFRDQGSVLIRQTDPLPLTVLAIMPSVELGG